MRGVLEIYDTLRSARIPAACYAVGKMKANQQGSAFPVSTLNLQRWGFVFFLQMQALFKIILPLKLFGFLNKIQVCIGCSCAQ